MDCSDCQVVCGPLDIGRPDLCCAIRYAAYVEEHKRLECRVAELEAWNHISDEARAKLAEDADWAENGTEGVSIDATEEVVMNHDALPPMLRGCRRYRLEYGGSNENCILEVGPVYLPAHLNIEDFLEWANGTGELTSAEAKRVRWLERVAEAAKEGVPCRNWLDHATEGDKCRSIGCPYDRICAALAEGGTE